MVMRHNVIALVRADVGSQLRLNINQPQSNPSPDLTVEYIRGELLLTRTDRNILVEGTLESAIIVECVRCLESFRLPLQIRLEELFFLSPVPRQADPMYVVGPDGIIDLTLPLREHALLAQPLNPLCRPDCKGLCSVCGTNWNESSCACQDESIDPRLAALKSLL